MIELSNLRKYLLGDSVVRLEANIKFIDMDKNCPTDTIYFDIDKEFGDIFVNDTYDPFVLVPLYLAMYNKTDLRIRGNISKKFYQNIKKYIQKILCDFSPNLAPVDIIVDGFAPIKPKGNLIGTGISCGVDSFATIYDYFIRENDPDYKINLLFLFNCGTNGNFEDEVSQKVFVSRGIRSIEAGKEMRLPVIPVDSNIHVLRDKNTLAPLIHLAIYSCALSLQNAVRRYYIGSAFSYNEIKSCGTKQNLFDLAEFSESYLVPLIQTERMELIIDGCQYRRVDKIKNIADWKIAQKYLNVCHVYKGSGNTQNCSECEKCMRTFLALEILDKLKNFSQIFDLKKYVEKSFEYKCKVVANADKDLFYRELVDLASEYDYPMPKRQDCYVLNKRVVIFEDK